jgi:hypothetical protein
MQPTHLIPDYIYIRENDIYLTVNKQMSRFDFLRKTGRYILLMLIVVIAVALGKKVVSGNNCSVCPGNGICKGETDCRNY